MSNKRGPGGAIALAGGVSGAVLAGIASVVLAASAVAQGDVPASTVILETSHVPPLLRSSDEPVELTFDAYCVDLAAQEADETCDVVGTAFVRVGANGPFAPLRLERSGSSESRLVARVPDEVASSRRGFTYYAEIEAKAVGALRTVPAGGAAAPHRSLPLGQALTIDLGRHEFGQTAQATERVAEAPWGDGPGDVGLEQGHNISPIGASAFDVDASGAVVLLDQANRRVLRWRRGARAPARVPLAIDGTIADLSLGADGTMYVLESVGRAGRGPLVKRFDTYGRELGHVEVAERTPSHIRSAPAGVAVLQYPSSQWMPIAENGSLIGPDSQRRRGRSGRALPGGAELVVLRAANEIRVALVGPEGVRRSWRIHSETPLAEIQLAEALGRHVLVVSRVYTDSDDEFVALVLGDEGLVRRTPIASSAWAETSALSRFRLAGGSLYRLGSTPTSAFVDRFELEVRR